MTRTAVTITTALCLSAGFLPMRLNAQVTLLTAGEAKELVEIVPEVVASRTRGECPALSLGEWSFDSSVFLIQARGECWSPGAPSSLLINNYAVDRRTGAVRVEGSKSVVSTPVTISLKVTLNCTLLALVGLEPEGLKGLIEKTVGGVWSSV